MAIAFDTKRGPRARVLWSRKDIGDMFEGVLTPLGASFCEAYQRDVHPACVAAMGVRDPGDARLYYRVVDGHLYANVAYFAHLYSQTPLGRDLATFTRAFTSDDVDVKTYVNPYGVHPRAKGRRELLVWSTSEVRALSRVLRTLATFRRDEPGATFDRVERLVQSRPSAVTLRRAIEDALERFRVAYADYMPVVLNAFTLHGIASELGRRWLGRASADLAQASRAMLDPRRKEHAARAAIATRGDVQRFVATFGAAGTQEMDLARPRWKDEPPAIGAGPRADASSGIPSAHWIIAVAPITFARKAAFSALFAALAAHAEARAHLRTRVVTRLWELRSLVFEAARGLHLRGAITSPHRIIYATLDEVLSVTRGVALPSASRLDDRRREYARCLALPPPPVAFVSEPPARPNAPAQSSTESA